LARLLCRLYFLAVLLIAIGAAAPCVAQTIELRNDHTVAKLGPRGLESLEDLDSHREIHFSSDRFSLEIDDTKLESASLKPAVSTPGGNQVIYSYASGEYRLEVRYELQPTWRFISKQIAIVQAPQAKFTVHRAEPVRVVLAEPFQSSYIPGSYFPHFGETRTQSRERMRGADYGAFVRFGHDSGAMFLVQNPFLKASVSGRDVSLAYSPEIDWNSTWGEFAADRACIGVYALSGERLPADMTLEWQLAPARPAVDGADRAEIEAFTDCVRAFLVNPAPEPISVEVGWTLNDYQIDVATPEGRAEYKRVMDTASELGIRNLLYAPANSDLAKREDDLDDWDWEHVLWLGFGQQIRKGVWKQEGGAIPAGVSEMLAYAKQKNIGLLAYVYPSLPFAQSDAWIVTNPKKKEKNRYATLASREFQDFLIRELLAFKKGTGIAGYAFDYTFLNLPGASQYAQWLGWKRVMETLRREVPDIVIDGRQTYQTYGPWTWLAGSYPHPTGTDEQPESFTPYPDLHFDRVSADRERYVDYWYRNYMFAPEELIPGYMTHQTERSRNVPVTTNGVTRSEEQFINSTYRARDWDYLGFKYSVISSSASGGWNDVMDMIPGRDLAEFQNFSAEDKKWIRDWIAWTRENKEFLRHTRTIIGQPAMGKVDGTAAIVADRGFIFLFNPNYEALAVHFSLDRSIGLTGGGDYVLRELYPRKGNLIGELKNGVWKHGEPVAIGMHGTSAKVIEVMPAKDLNASAENALPVFNGGPRATAKLDGTRLIIEDASNEMGSEAEIGVEVPEGSAVTSISVNGIKQHFMRSGDYIHTEVLFGGLPFWQAEKIQMQANAYVSEAGTFSVPKWVFDQLAARKKAWPIPWTSDDYETTWLAPERLLLFVQIAEPRDSIQVSMAIDGRTIELKKAYSSVREHADSFVGFYADVSKIEPDVSHKIVLNLPRLKPGQFQGVFFENVEPEYTEAMRDLH
jgi:hypothetical protein